MQRRDFLRAAGLGMVSYALGGCAGWAGSSGARGRRPNVIVIYTDDQGYGDLGCFGATDLATPNFDRLCREGVQLTDFYVGAPVCAPSRAALMTGCYPQRVGVPWNINADSDQGLSPDETTMATMLQRAGYATACFGKWHLGHEPQFLPTSHGFDEFFGLPYSHDMTPASAQVYTQWADIISQWPPLPLMHNETVVETEPDPNGLTARLTEAALGFIRGHRDEPFFVYLAHAMPHVPLGVSERFRGVSGRGLYGDVIAELDWSVGQVLETLRNEGLDEHTVVIFASDNGPWLAMGNHAGSAGPLRGGKMNTFDGGQRTPCVMRWPVMIPAGQVCAEPVVAMDILPTVARWAHAELPPVTIDGRDIGALVTGQAGAASPHEAIFFYRNRELQAVRCGRWKLHVAHPYQACVERGRDGRYGRYETRQEPLALYDLRKDIAETNNVAAAHPEIVARLQGHIDRMRQELGDSNLGIRGGGVRHFQDIAEH